MTKKICFWFLITSTKKRHYLPFKSFTSNLTAKVLGREKKKKKVDYSVTQRSATDLIRDF